MWLSLLFVVDYFLVLVTAFKDFLKNESNNALISPRTGHREPATCQTPWRRAEISDRGHIRSGYPTAERGLQQQCRVQRATLVRAIQQPSRFPNLIVLRHAELVRVLLNDGRVRPLPAG